MAREEKSKEERQLRHTTTEELFQVPSVTCISTYFSLLLLFLDGVLLFVPPSRVSDTLTRATRKILSGLRTVLLRPAWWCSFGLRRPAAATTTTTVKVESERVSQLPLLLLLLLLLMLQLVIVDPIIWVSTA
ncbi:hypothetical protein QBC33DRAFT_78917 [Phialemonium atrogriseum]|uniref:Transmembrane protein n=1 Tax=Phialemonium atrogriseum TaxID=1093897 RepID=A0AAJ0C1T6_9PEZI|nr:uncharacterized protein QBC33DRAFT_78917 [Phialemonium atrogriseum]KAK1767137.1 hypothetical protein QBC33DRAFT_78917 [Phialemonium atrogriseum]